MHIRPADGHTIKGSLACLVTCMYEVSVKAVVKLEHVTEN